MAVEFSEVARLVISLLPVIVIIIVFRWIIKLFAEMDFDSDYDWDYPETSDNTPEFEDTPKITATRIKVKCDSCGANNEELDAFCGYCGSSLYQQDTIRVSPRLIE